MGDVQSSVDDTNPYFLGSIVLVKGDAPHADIVDGQQRLTTLTILFAAIRTLLTPEEAAGVTPLLCETANPILGTRSRYRLTLREQDKLFFCAFVQQPDGIEKLQHLNQAHLTDSQKNIRDNALFFVKEATKLPPEQRSRLIQFAARRCSVVAVSTPDFDSAYRIFTVLNNRGLNLTHSDILKAELIGSISPEHQQAYTRKWESVEDELGREGFQELFAHIRMIYRKTKLSETLLQEYKKHIVPVGSDAARFIDETLLPYADAYAIVKTSSYQSTSGAEEVNGLLRWLNQIDNVDWMPPAIVFMARNNPDTASMVHFLRDLERLAAAQMIIRSNINERIARYGRVLVAMEQGQDLFSAASPLQLGPSEKQAVKMVLDGNLYEEAKVRLYVLLRLDSELSRGQATYSYPSLTVEHVLPQTPSKNSIWLRVFENDDLRLKWTHRIGNLVLLPRRKNSEAQNYDFDVKKQKYFSSAKGVATFALTTQVLNEKEWTPQIVERRQNQLVAALEALWRLV
jgi:hypothetical protein